MPLYTYLCTLCNKTHSALQSLGSQVTPKCSSCGIDMQRMVKPTSFSIGGPGVYKQGFSAPKGKQATTGSIFKPTGGKKK